MSDCSQARIDANRLNALKSTGPRTAEGKAIARGNATKHGFCAVVIDMPGEDTEALVDRFDEWQDDLNPRHHAAQTFLIQQAIRHSARLDRCNVVFNAKAAKVARDAHKSMKAKRMRLVEKLARMLIADCDNAVRRLRLIPEGCAYLIGEWEGLRITLELPAHFDRDDELIVLRLLGRVSIVRGKAPAQTGLAMLAITEHRVMAKKLKLNENPKRCMWQDLYKDEIDHQKDRDAIDFLFDKSERYRRWLIKLIDDNTAELRVLQASLEAEDLAEVAEVPYRAMFDASDEGKLLHRYEMDSERSILRHLKEVRELNKHDTQLLQDVDPIAVTKSSLVDRSEAKALPSARNEPIEASLEARLDRVANAIRAESSYIPINMTKPRRSRHQR